MSLGAGIALSKVWGRFGWGSCRIKKALARQQVVFKVKGPKPNCQSNSCHSRGAQGWCCSCCMQLSRKIWLHNAAAVPWQWSSGLGDEAPWNGKWMERERLKCHERCWFPGCICWPRVLVCSALCSAALLEDKEAWKIGAGLRASDERGQEVRVFISAPRKPLGDVGRSRSSTQPGLLCD